MNVKLIVARSKNNVIGKDNDLIWHLPADMRFFTNATKDHIVIMGRRNWDSIPLKYRPLSERTNVVITRNTEFQHPDCTVFNSMEAALAYYEINKNEIEDVYIIGGGQIYDYAIQHDLVDEMLITEIDHEFEGDTFFTKFEESNWDKTMIMDHPIDEKNKYPFKVYQYTRKK